MVVKRRFGPFLNFKFDHYESLFYFDFCIMPMTCPGDHVEKRLEFRDRTRSFHRDSNLSLFSFEIFVFLRHNDLTTSICCIFRAIIAAL